MNSLVILLNILFLAVPSLGQDCYKEGAQDNLKLNYCQLWMDRTFQGTIGDDNQRIEIRFLEIYQNPNLPSRYLVNGKSRVHNNVCDFSGAIIIDKVMLLDELNGGCDPGLAEGMLYGTYEFKENLDQNHVGVFKGQFRMMFDRRMNSFAINQGVLGQDGFNSFLGTWGSYNKEEPRFCAWGLQLPPSMHDDLFKHYDKEYYLFDSKYMDRGWRTYVLSNLNTFIKVPQSFETNELRFDDDFIEYPIDEIDQAIKEEEKIWWN